MATLVFDQYLDRLGDRLGNWNPQLYRELKGKLKPRNLAIAIGISLTIQALFLAWFWLQLPSSNIAETMNNRSAYCVGDNRDGSIFSVFGKIYNCYFPLQILWQAWWLDQFRIISWIMPPFLSALGSAFLAIDIAQESQRGTLNFIRLSPQSGRSILWGKLLGVPALIGLMVLAVIPLHLIAAIGAGISFKFLASYYLMSGMGIFLLYSLSLLAGLVLGTGNGNRFFNPTTVGIGIGAVSFGLMFGYMGLNLLTTWANFEYLVGKTYFPIDWFNLPVSNSVAIANIFGGVSTLIAIQGVWYGLERSYNLPNRPVLSKRQSYVCLVFFEVFLVGFLVRLSKPDIPYFESLAILNFLNLVAFNLLIIILSPQRQTLLDWARYRQASQTRKSIWHELVWAENSPAPVAIGINAVVAAMIALPWLISGKDLDSIFQVLLAITSQILGFLIYATIYQSLVFWSANPRKKLISLVVFGGLAFIPFLALFFDRYAFLPYEKVKLLVFQVVVFVAYPAAGVIKHGAFMGLPILGAIAIQVGILSFFSFKLKNTLQKAGASEFKQFSDSQIRVTNLLEVQN